MGKKDKGGKKGKKAVDLTEPGNIPAYVGEGYAKVAVAIGVDPAVAKRHAEILLGNIPADRRAASSSQQVPFSPSPPLLFF